MSSRKGKKRAETSDSDSDSGPDDRGPAKKVPKTAPKKDATSDDGESTMFKLSRMRFVNVREFRGKVMVDIREFYDKDGDMRPGKKGICLSLEQWNALKEHIESIDDAIKEF